MNIEDKHNTPFFDLEDVANACHPLTKLLRLFYTHLKMTHSDWNKRFNDWCYKCGLYSPKQVESQRGNTRNQLQADDMTFKVFLKGVSDIAGGTIRDMSVTLEVKTPEGRKTIVVSLSDVIDLTTGEIKPKKSGES